MSPKTANDYAKLLELLPKLLVKITAAQVKLQSVDNNLAVSLAAVNKSVTATSSLGITTFTPAFEKCSESFCMAVEETAEVLFSTCESIEQIEYATQQIVAGINSQLNPNIPQFANQESNGPNTTRSSIPRLATRTSSTQLAARPPKFPDLVKAIDSLDAKLLRRP